MPGPGRGQRVCDLMQDRIPHFPFIVQLDKISGQRNPLLSEVTPAEPDLGSIEMERPPWQEIMPIHQMVRQVSSFRERHDGRL
jgi:hypothetical protein